jgi:hypothetical protein
MNWLTYCDDGAVTLQHLNEHFGDETWVESWLADPTVPDAIAKEIDGFHEAHMAEFLGLAERCMTMDMVEKYGGTDIAGKMAKGEVKLTCSNPKTYSTFVPRKIPPINAWSENFIENKSCHTYYLKQDKGDSYRHSRMIRLFSEAQYHHQKRTWDKEQNADPMMVRMMAEFGPFALPEEAASK